MRCVCCGELRMRARCVLLMTMRGNGQPDRSTPVCSIVLPDLPAHTKLHDDGLISRAHTHSEHLDSSTLLSPYPSSTTQTGKPSYIVHTAARIPAPPCHQAYSSRPSVTISSHTRTASRAGPLYRARSYPCRLQVARHNSAPISPPQTPNAVANCSANFVRLRIGYSTLSPRVRVSRARYRRVGVGGRRQASA
jgi:hypothetical protein